MLFLTTNLWYIGKKKKKFNHKTLSHSDKCFFFFLLWSPIYSLCSTLKYKNFLYELYSSTCIMYSYFNFYVDKKVSQFLFFKNSLSFSVEMHQLYVIRLLNPRRQFAFTTCTHWQANFVLRTKGTTLASITSWWYIV